MTEVKTSQEENFSPDPYPPLIGSRLTATSFTRSAEIFSEEEGPEGIREKVSETLRYVFDQNHQDGRSIFSGFIPAMTSEHCLTFDTIFELIRGREVANSAEDLELESYVCYNVFRTLLFRPDKVPHWKPRQFAQILRIAISKIKNGEVHQDKDGEYLKRYNHIMDLVEANINDDDLQEAFKEFI